MDKEIYENLIRAVLHPVNAGFTLIMFYLFFKYRKEPLASQSLPAILVSIGILGTFTGIFYGLLGFNVGTVEEMRKSVPELLAGLKIAFFTSIVGLVLSTWIKAKETIRKIKLSKSKAEVPIDTVETIPAILKNVLFRVEFISNLLQSFSSGLVKQFENINASLNELKEINQNQSTTIHLSEELSKDFSQLIEIIKTIDMTTDEVLNNFEAVNEAVDNIGDIKTTTKELSYDLKDIITTYNKNQATPILNQKINAKKPEAESEL